jgi:hypothetical protein
MVVSLGVCFEATCGTNSTVLMKEKGSFSKFVKGVLHCLTQLF